MVPEIKLVVSSNNEIIETVTKPISKGTFYEDIKNFQEIANATLTKLINENEEGGDVDMTEEADFETDEEDVTLIPKRKKK